MNTIFKSKILLIFFLFNALISFPQSLSGTYTVGGILPDYETIDLAVQDLISEGISNDVTFNIRSGNFVENIAITQFVGTTLHSVTFQSESLDSNAVQISNPSGFISDNHIFRLNGVSNIYLKHLSFNAGKNNTSCVIISNSKNIKIENCSFSNHNKNDVTLMSVNASSSIDSTENIVIENNRFYSGERQLMVSGNGNVELEKIEILNNTFINVSGNTEDIIEVIFTKDLSILKNKISGFVGNNTNSFKIEFCSGEIIVNQNKIQISSLGSILGGVIQNCTNPGTSTMVKNNFFAGKGDYGKIGLSIHSCSNLNILNNSFSNRFINDPGNGGLSFISSNIIYSGTLDTILVHNNIFALKNQDGFQKMVNNSDTSHFTSNYNAFYSDTKADEFNLGLEPTMSNDNWNVLLDESSHFINPNFVSDFDLHINNSTQLINAGLFLPQIIYDIDGDLRNSSQMTIGADEFIVDSISFNDLKLEVVSPTFNSCIAPDSVINLRIINNSANIVDSFDVFWRLYSYQRDSLRVYETILPGDSVDIPSFDFHFEPNINYNLGFSVKHLNPVMDDNISNNYISNSNYYFHDFEIHSRKIPCSSDIELYIKSLPYESALWSNGSNSNKIVISNPGVYSVTLTNINGCSVTKNITIN